MGIQEEGPAGSKAEVRWPMRVFGRDRLQQREWVGTDGVLFFDNQWGAYQRSLSRSVPLRMKQ